MFKLNNGFISGLNTKGALDRKTSRADKSISRSSMSQAGSRFSTAKLSSASVVGKGSSKSDKKGQKLGKGRKK